MYPWLETGPSSSSLKCSSRATGSCGILITVHKLCDNTYKNTQETTWNTSLYTPWLCLLTVLNETMYKWFQNEVSRPLWDFHFNKRVTVTFVVSIFYLMKKYVLFNVKFNFKNMFRSCLLFIFHYIKTLHIFHYIKIHLFFVVIFGPYSKIVCVIF